MSVEDRTPVEELSYREAIDEIDEILAEIESDKLDVDTLAPLVERAAALVENCRERLASTDVKVRDALDALSSEEAE
jgi:exodeoxyribonuclease VII small subunit